MGARKGSWNRLEIVSPRRAGRVERQDGTAGRHCVQCPRPVLDLRRVLQGASAGFLAAWLGLGVASALPEPKAPEGSVASLRGIVRDPQGEAIPGFEVVAINALDGTARRTFSGQDGGFAFDGLDAGIYDLGAEHEGFTAAPRPGLLLRSSDRLALNIYAQPGEWEALDTSDFGMGAEPLRQLSDESELVVLATAGLTQPAGTDDPGEVVSALRLDRVLKGREAAHEIRVVHLPAEDVAARPFAPGATVLAFLKVRADGAYEPIDASFGLKALAGAEVSAYRERIESLVGLPRNPELRPDDLAEWLVATTEEPLTRKGSASEIHSALDALSELATEAGASVEGAAADLRSIVARRLAAGKGLESEPSPAMVAAYLTDEHRDRLLRALEESPTLDRADLTLYEIVKTWDAEAALSWFVRQMRDVDPAATKEAPADIGVQIMESLARELANPQLQARVRSAQDRLIAIYSDPASFGPAPALRRREVREGEVARALLRDFRQALAELD